MPHQQYICDQYENFHLDRQAFQHNKIKGILNHTDECIKQSLCDVADLESNTDSNANIGEDGLHQVNPAYGNFICITLNCKNCSMYVVKMKILEANEGIEKCKEEITWYKWKWV